MNAVRRSWWRVTLTGEGSWWFRTEAGAQAWAAAHVLPGEWSRLTIAEVTR